MRVVWLTGAKDDLAAIRRYIQRDNPEAAARVAGRIVRAVHQLADTPQMGRPGRVVGTREVVVPGIPYVVPYRVAAGRVEILAVLHTSRRWPKVPDN